MVDISRVYSDHTVIWQESVYEEARAVAEKVGVSRIVDIGVGAGRKLVTAFSDFPADLLQVDWADNRERPDGAETPPFFQANLEDAYDLDALRLELDRPEPTLMILSDVIEHLDDPRLLLRVLRATLRKNPSNRLIISTPDRERIDGKGTQSIPDNPTHIRQWTINEFEFMLKASGFRVEAINLAPENKFDKFNRTVIAQVSCDDEFYAGFLAHHELPPSADHLVITTEHSHALRTGGIGTYYQLAEEHSGNKRLTLYCGGAGLPDDWNNFARKAGWMHCADICGRGSESLAAILNVNHHEILEATLLVLFLYDQVRLIEYQDYMGIGVHVAQAKRARLLPASVFVMAYAHGNHLYLDNAAGAISKERELAVDLRERLSVELADCVIFPSKFLENLYLNIGGFKPRRHASQPYPIRLPKTELIETDFGKISTLVFYGKHTEQKGYYDFCDAVLELFRNQNYAATATQIKKIVILGSTNPDERLLKIPNVEVTFGIFSRIEVVNKLKKLSPHSLVIMPYKGDNHPLSTFEVIDSNSQLIAYRAGGIPEQLPEELHEYALCDPNHKALAAAIHKNVNIQFWERCELIKRARASTAWQYDHHGANYLNLIESFKNFELREAAEHGNVSLIVPNYNGSAGYLDDAIVGMRNSFKKPSEIFFVDDCSTADNFDVLIEKGKNIEGLKTHVLRNEVNLGLSGSRNVALNQVSTKYVCAHDNDNILLNRFLDISCRILDENPEVDVVTCWTIAFNDGDIWQADSTTTLKYRYRPIGPDIGLGLKDNTFGDAMAVYRTSTLKEVGGWDQSTKALWEDWQLFLKLAALGKQIWVIPKEMILYRVRPSSMLRTYPKFNGWLRIANALPSLPSNQRFGMMRALLTPEWQVVTERWSLTHQVNTLGDQVNILGDQVNILRAENARYQSDLERLRAVDQHAATMSLELARLRAIESSTTWRASRRLHRWVENHPFVQRILRVLAKGMAFLVRKRS